MAIFGFVVYYRRPARTTTAEPAQSTEDFVIATGDSLEEAAANVAEKFSTFAVDSIKAIHIEDTLDDYYDGVARCSNSYGWRFNETQRGGYFKTPDRCVGFTEQG